MFHIVKVYIVLRVEIVAGGIYVYLDTGVLGLGYVLN